MKRSIGIAVAVVMFALPASAFGQATRTWVSGVGDDVNPCSRTAPCKTFAGAISKTATGGEINAIDSGGFGSVTITKSITIDGAGVLASQLASGTTGVIINITSGADSAKKVVLRNLSINGTGTTFGTDGVRIDAANNVRVENTQIFNFSQSGIDFTPTSATTTRLTVVNSTIEDNLQTGVDVAAPAGAPVVGESTQVSRFVIHNSSLIGNTTAAVQLRPTPAGTRVVRGIVSSSLLAEGGTGVLADGPQAQVRISGDTIATNIFGIQPLNASLITSSGNNVFAANGTDGVPSSTVALK